MMTSVHPTEREKNQRVNIGGCYMEQKSSSHLFTLRVWSEVAEDSEIRWRGKLYHVSSGEIRHFRGWAALVPLLLDLLRRHPADPNDL
jgi:predicted Zn-dependent protease